MKLSEKALEALAKHKYSGVDDSILAKLILSKYWNYCLKFVPITIAPNLITLTGTLCLVFTFITVGLYSPELEGTLPSWLYILCGLSLFFYQTMDNLDGKQARRTGTSSPLGQLFDHGCDSIVCTIQSLIVSSVGNYGIGYLTLIQLFTTALLPFWMATWEEYHTGTLYLGPINGPDEGIVIIVIILLTTGFIGPSFWTSKPIQVYGLSKYVPYQLSNLKLNELIVLSLSLPTVITIFANIRNVVQHLKRNNKPILPALKHILVWIIITGCTFVWYFCSTELYAEDSIWFSYVRIIQLSIGIIFGQLVSRLILAHMCHEKYNVLQTPLIPLIFATFVSFIQWYNQSEYVSEYFVLIMFVTLSFMHYFIFAKATIDQLCSFLKINCFTIPKQGEKTN
ncbi:hypothetical protein CYY_008950 [Polysphondylium violaceum]|uniref:CDP-alcohol phosphatidyltransferase n=1 Tax=Polysphondylium violaceum TaxID=133409 RepID=A0A8J4PME6_9MYCE|nr:hypothetical protein CYY_008950 [Polysphondylium violaceum]